MRKNLFIITIVLLFTSCFGSRNLVKTGTLADRKINLTYFMKDLEIKTAKGEKVKVTLTSNGSSYVTKKGKYIANPEMFIAEKFRQETAGEELKKSSITGNEKMVPVIKKTSEGFVAKYSFKLAEKSHATGIYKVKLNILNSAGDFETIHEHIFTNKEKEELLNTGTTFKSESNIFIPKDKYVKGDRKFLYIYQIILEDSSGNILERLNAYSLLYYHEINYNYIQGYY